MDTQNNNLIDSVLNVPVSFFTDYRTITPRDTNLLDFLSKKAYLEEIALIRNEKDKKIRDMLKSKIGAITPSGVFTERKNSGLVKHSGFLQFDIDYKENAHITNYDSLQNQLKNIPNVAFCGHSVSYTGYWGLVKIAYPEKHLQHFRALQKSFARLGITIDPSCSDVSRLRGYSYDEDAYFNHNPAPFYLLDEPARKKLPDPANNVIGNKSNNTEKILRAIEQIQVNRLDITDGYKNWFAIAASIANEFGEAGRIYLHKISSQNFNYDANETDKQFDNCLSNKYDYSFGTFIFYCRSKNIII